MEPNEQVPVNQYYKERNVPPAASQFDPGEKTASDSRLFVLRRRESSPTTKEVV